MTEGNALITIGIQYGTQQLHGRRKSAELVVVQAKYNKYYPLDSRRQKHELGR